MSQEPQHPESLVSVTWLNKANTERDTAIALMKVALDQREKTEALNAELLAALKETTRLLTKLIAETYATSQEMLCALDTAHALIAKAK
jgi:hypothetical protein